MKNLELNLDAIKKHATEHKNEFELFRWHVKKMSVTQFDLMASEVVNEISNKIDCTQCGNCCKVQEPGISKEEMDVLAVHNGISTEEFQSQFVATDRDGVHFLCSKPCVFLNGSMCSIYNDRPASCADFPGLMRPGLKWRMNQMEYNYQLCPIVFNVVERLMLMVP